MTNDARYEHTTNNIFVRLTDNSNPNEHQVRIAAYNRGIFFWGANVNYIVVRGLSLRLQLGAVSAATGETGTLGTTSSHITLDQLDISLNKSRSIENSFCAVDFNVTHSHIHDIEYEGIHLESDRGSLDQNVIEETIAPWSKWGSMGINVLGSNNRISQNIIRDIRQTETRRGGAGIFMEQWYDNGSGDVKCHNQTNQNNVVEQNEIYDNEGAGIYNAGGDDNTITNNLVYNNGGAGINVSAGGTDGGPTEAQRNAESNSISNNTLYANRGDAIALTAAAQNTQMRDNMISNEPTARIPRAAVLSALALPLIALLALYLVFANSYFLGAPQNSHGPAHILLRSGSPRLKFIPGAGRVVLETDFTLDDVIPDPRVRDEILNEKLRSFGRRHTRDGYDESIEPLLLRLDLLSKGRALQWLGQSERAQKILTAVLNNSHADSSTHRRAALGQSQFTPRASSEIITDLVRSTNEPAAAHSQGDNSANTPENKVSLSVVQAAMTILRDDRADVELRRGAADDLAQFARMNPDALRTDLIQELIALLRDPPTDESLRIQVARVILQRAQSDHEAVPLELIQPLLADLRRDDSSSVRLTAAYALFALSSGAAPFEEIVRAELQKMRESSNPQRRITAAKLWEMLEIGKSVRAVRREAEQINSSLPTLEELQNSPEEHIAFAARVLAPLVRPIADA